MTKTVLGAVLCVVLFLCAHRPASALTEFCPATLKYQAVGQNEDYTGLAALYGFELTALAPRTITSATLAFDTSAGWYTVNVPATTLKAKSRRYYGDGHSFERTDYVSPIMYARFPVNASIRHAWVQNANQVSCDPPAAPSPAQQKDSRYTYHFLWYTLEANDEDALGAVPSGPLNVLAAQASPAMGETNCAEPFREVTTQHAWLSPYDSGPLAQVAIDRSGAVRDAWFWGPPTFNTTKAQVLMNAKREIYTGARAYCQPVPSVIFFGMPWPKAG